MKVCIHVCVSHLFHFIVWNCVRRLCRQLAIIGIYSRMNINKYNSFIQGLVPNKRCWFFSQLFYSFKMITQLRSWAEIQNNFTWKNKPIEIIENCKYSSAKDFYASFPLAVHPVFKQFLSSSS